MCVSLKLDKAYLGSINALTSNNPVSCRTDWRDSKYQNSHGLDMMTTI